MNNVLLYLLSGIFAIALTSCTTVEILELPPPTGDANENSDGSNTGSGNPLFCDYGHPTTDGIGGCYQIDDPSECDTKYGVVGLVAESCGRTDLRYCDWGPINALYGGGCYVLETDYACTSTEGRIVNICPESSLGYTTNTNTSEQYCDYGYITDNGGGCFPITPTSSCNTQWGRVVSVCGSRTDLRYCRRTYNTHCYSTTASYCDAGDITVSDCGQLY